MKKLTRILAALTAVVLLASCSGTTMRMAAPAAAVTPTEVRLNVDYSQMQLLGEVSIEVSSTVYLGFIRDIHTVNGEDYDFRHTKTTYLPGRQSVHTPWVLRRALYKAVEQFPQADFFVPVHSTTEKQRMFLGHNETTSMVVRAYQYKRNG